MQLSCLPPLHLRWSKRRINYSVNTSTKNEAVLKAHLHAGSFFRIGKAVVCVFPECSSGKIRNLITREDMLCDLVSSSSFHHSHVSYFWFTYEYKYSFSNNGHDPIKQSYLMSQRGSLCKDFLSIPINTA